MSGVLNTIGLISGVLGIVSFFESNLPSAVPEGAAVGVKIGRHPDGTNLGGTITRVDGFDASNIFIGGDGREQSGDAGGILNFTLDQNDPGIQADFVGVSAGDDAVCVAWVTVQNTNGQPNGIWTGDIGYKCGQVWFMNNQEASADYTPMCTWLDRNGDPTQTESMKFNRKAYREEADSHQGDVACGSTIYSNDAGPIAGAPAKRSLKPRSEAMANTLVDATNGNAIHQAALLCESETSWGPDFIGVDGKYCDMGTKTLHTLCSTEDVAGCVTIENNSTLVQKVGGAKTLRSRSLRTFNTVETW